MHFLSSQCWKKLLLVAGVLFLLGSTAGVIAPAFANEEKKGGSDKTERVRRSPPKKKDREEKKKEADFDNNVGDKSFSHDQFDSSAEDEAKVDALVLLDSSGSMQRTDPKRLRDQAAKLFVRFFGDTDRVSVFQFDQEVKRVSTFAPVTVESVKELDGALPTITNSGRFTDLELPLEAAFATLQAEGRKEAKKIVILLSDGQMDPHPERGTAENLTAKLFGEVLPQYRAAQIPVYTVAMSPEADREYLNKIAAESGGMRFDAQDVHTLHKSFSDLFLSLKRPQTVELAKGGFEIDSNVHEATFYIARKDAAQEVSLFSPTGEKITMLEFPPGVRWYRGELFDVVTIRKPAAGAWRVEGIDAPEGFATLLTDLKLQVHLAKTSLNVGDSQNVFARLTSKGKILDEPGIKSVTSYHYKVVSSSTGSVLQQGVLEDNGEAGDEKAEDGIYSTLVRGTEEGNFKLFVSDTSATFSRSQQIPLEFSKGSLELALIPGDEFAKTPEQFSVTLTQRGKKLRSPEVEILAKNLATSKILVYKVKPAGKGGDYKFDTQKLSPGKYSVTARLSGKDPKSGDMQRSNSEAIEYERVGPPPKEGETAHEVHEGEGHEEGATELSGESSEEHGPPASRDWLWGLIALALAIAWSGGIVYMMTKRIDFGKNLPAKEEAWERSPQLIERMKKLKDKGSERKRPPTPKEFEVFSLVPDAFPAAPPPAAEGAGEETV